MKKIKTIAITSFILLLTLIMVYSTYAQKKTLDRIVAVIGKEIVLESDLQQQIEFYVMNNRIDPETPGLKNQVLDMLMNEKLIVAKAIDDTNVVVTEDEVTQQLDALLQQNIQQVGSEQKLEEIYGMPLSKIRREFRDEMRKKLLAQRMQQFRFANISVSRRETELFFEAFRDSLPDVEEEVELYHILKIPSKSAEVLGNVKTLAGKILDSIKAGGDFADFAMRYSEDKGSALAGGDLGFTRRGQFVKEFEEAAYALKEGQISGLVESTFGIHIIQLIERRGENIHARHILFKVEADEKSDVAAVELLNKIADSVRAGANFSEFAKRYSDDSESASIGGFIGRVPLDELSKDFLDSVAELNEGEISQPLLVKTGTSGGFQIVYLKKRIPAHKISLSTDWQKIEIYASNFKRNNEFQKWIQDLRKEIFWQVR
ncbi:MAG: peptidylprolyl isomerase [Bacteroidota bacterium]|nr:peptidylprolyl isomerase [Bacteroidota bacterium]